MKKIIIVGAGGFGLEVAAYIEDMHQSTNSFSCQIIGFLDDTKTIGSQHAGYQVIGPTNQSVASDAFYIIALGDPHARKKITYKLDQMRAQFTTIIHPSSYIAPSASILEGSIIAPFSFVGPQSHVGRHCVVNTHASVGHEAIIENFSVLSPYSILHGKAKIGECVFMGNGACILANQTIGDQSKIAAGAIVYNNVWSNHLAIGNPARTKPIV